jgi:peptidoglycan/LPS O-acetylase OafA/YrhL
VIVTAAVLVALVLYRLVEQPGLALREYIRRRLSASSNIEGAGLS